MSVSDDCRVGDPRRRGVVAVCGLTMELGGATVARGALDRGGGGGIAGTKADLEAGGSMRLG